MYPSWMFPDVGQVTPSEPKRLPLDDFDFEVVCLICGKVTTVTGAMRELPECCGIMCRRREE